MRAASKSSMSVQTDQEILYIFTVTLPGSPTEIPDLEEFFRSKLPRDLLHKSEVCATHLMPHQYNEAYEKVIAYAEKNGGRAVVAHGLKGIMRVYDTAGNRTYRITRLLRIKEMQVKRLAADASERAANASEDQEKEEN